MWYATALVIAVVAIHSWRIERIHRDDVERQRTLIETVVLLTALNNRQRLSIEGLDHEVHAAGAGGALHRAVP
jgi:hypothetical protein